MLRPAWLRDTGRLTIRATVPVVKGPTRAASAGSARRRTCRTRARSRAPPGRRGGGASRLERVRITTADGVEETLEARGLFVFIGAMPRTAWLDGTIVTNEHGFATTGPALPPDRWSLDRDPFLLATSMPAVFAVGDVRSASVKRVASAVGEGSVAVPFVHEVLRGA